MQKLVIIGGSNAFWEISELIDDINKVQNKYKIIAKYRKLNIEKE